MMYPIEIDASKIKMKNSRAWTLIQPYRGTKMARNLLPKEVSKIRDSYYFGSFIFTKENLRLTLPKELEHNGWSCEEKNNSFDFH